MVSSASSQEAVEGSFLHEQPESIQMAVLATWHIRSDHEEGLSLLCALAHGRKYASGALSGDIQPRFHSRTTLLWSSLSLSSEPIRENESFGHAANSMMLETHSPQAFLFRGSNTHAALQ
jgi:hypothetical protein